MSETLHELDTFHMRDVDKRAESGKKEQNTENRGGLVRRLMTKIKRTLGRE